MIIVGIDPGSLYAGMAVLSKESNQIHLLALEYVEVPGGLTYDKKILYVTEAFHKIVDEFNPQVLALEESFVGKNVQSALRLAEIRGALSYLASSKEIRVENFATRKIKKSITGNGNSSKEQLAFYLKNQFKIEQELPLDVTDALALAYHASLHA